MVLGVCGETVLGVNVFHDLQVDRVLDGTVEHHLDVKALSGLTGHP